MREQFSLTFSVMEAYVDRYFSAFFLENLTPDLMLPASVFCEYGTKGI